MLRLYSRFIEPRSSDPDAHNRELILNYLLVGLLLLSTFAFLGTFLSMVLSGKGYMVGRLLNGGVITLIFALLYYLARVKRLLRAVSLVLISLLIMIIGIMMYQWGLFTPAGLLLSALVIVMSGILLGARYSLYVLCLLALLFGALQYGVTSGSITPDTAWMQRSSVSSDVFGFLIILATLAFVSWLFNYQMERSLKRARRSEAALTKQKALLEIKVEERTRDLQRVQLEKVQQVYRFAELGRVSSALFHDLANHLANVLLDIEGLKPSGRSEIMKRIQSDIGYIDDVVRRVRLQLRGNVELETFDAINEIEQVVKILSYKSLRAKVHITVTRPKPDTIMFTSDVTRFRQIIINLLSNAIEAYPEPTRKKTAQRNVVLDIEQKDGAIVIRVTDWGVGIKPARKTKVFEPFYTDKKEGTGIGLFIVRQIIEQDMDGSIELTSTAQQGTIFTVHLPLS